MNVLLLSPWLPWPLHDGGRIRIFETLRYLSRHHTVSLVTPVCGNEEAYRASPVNGFCKNIITNVLSHDTGAVFSRLSKGLLSGRSLVESFYYDPCLARRIRELTAKGAYDIIQVEFPFLTSYLEALDPRCRAKKILSMHNIESLRFERELQVSRWGKRRLVLLGDHYFFHSWEKRAIRRFDGIVTVSELERGWARQHAPGATVDLIPNGVDTEYFRPASCVSSNRNLYLVFTGAMDYPPNIDAAVWFCTEVLPVLQRHFPGLGFKIVGKNPAPPIVELGKSQGIQVTGTVADIRSYMAGALALVVPLRSGGGTRLKILEAMAMERPVISTSVGAEGLEITPESNILIADKVQEFVNHVESLLKSPEKSKNLGTAGRRLVVEKYDWRVCLSGLDRLYGTLLEGAAA
jgi:sugar transferase (PEP-CTERM/EpsH1 system associated)